VIFNCYRSAKYRLVAVEYFRMKLFNRPPSEIVHGTSHLVASSRMCLISLCDASLWSAMVCQVFWYTCTRGM